ncbi:MAG: methylenetetrahydrofolate reductase, partial [bacterium]
KIEGFARICKTTVPDEIKAKMYPLLGKPDEMRKIGTEFAVRQCEDLLDNGVTYIHFYTLNRSAAVAEILDALM